MINMFDSTTHFDSENDYTAQIVETSVTVNNNSPIHDYFHPDDQTQPTFDIMRLTFYQNLLIGQETSVCFPHEWVPFPATNKTVHNNEVSVKAGAHKVGFYCTLILVSTLWWWLLTQLPWIVWIDRW